MTLPASSAEPPPNATTPSCSPARIASSPAATLRSVGFGCTSEKTAGSSPSARIASSARAVIGRVARPGSVTNSGRSIPAALQARPSSAIRPGPKRMVVG